MNHKITPISTALFFVLLLNGCAMTHSISNADVELTSEEVKHALEQATLPALDYPAEARQLGVEGRVVARYRVNANGEAEQVKIIEGIGYGCDEAVIDWIQAGSFEPLLNEQGYPRSYWLTVPVVFKLS